MLCKVLEECYTVDCRRLHKGDVTNWTGPDSDRPSYFVPMTELEQMRFMARTSDEAFARLDQGGIPPDPVRPPEPDKPVTILSVDREKRILDALEELDHEDDSHWTSSGQPLMDAVSAIAGDDTITRAELLTIAPGYRRRA